MTTAEIWEPIAARARDLTAGWRRAEENPVVGSFVRALAMLSLSLVAALYANGSARDGRIIATGIGALVAMSIAVWVTVRLVPKLAGGVDWQWRPVFTRYRITREGMIFVAATLVVGAAALNTSNNLLYMVLAGMLAVLLLSGFLSSLNFKALEPQVRVPERCHAGQPFTLSAGVRNRKKMFASISIEIAPGTKSPCRFDPHYVPLVRPGTLETGIVTTTLPSRGRWRIEQVVVRSRYPFGFISKGRSCDVDAEIVAYPALLAADAIRLTLPDLLGCAERFSRGNGMDLYGIREYVSTDSARHVDWKASARTAGLKTREYASEESQRILIELDRFAEPGPAFERLVSETASAAVHLVRNGAEVTLVTDEWTSPAVRTSVQMDEILLYLAEVSTTQNAPTTGHGGSEALRFSLRHRDPRTNLGFGDPEAT